MTNELEELLNDTMEEMDESIQLDMSGVVDELDSIKDLYYKVMGADDGKVLKSTKVLLEVPWYNRYIAICQSWFGYQRSRDTSREATEMGSHNVTLLLKDHGYAIANLLSGYSNKSEITKRFCDVLDEELSEELGDALQDMEVTTPWRLSHSDFLAFSRDIDETVYVFESVSSSDKEDIVELKHTINADGTANFHLVRDDSSNYTDISFSKSRARTPNKVITFLPVLDDMKEMNDKLVEDMERYKGELSGAVEELKDEFSSELVIRNMTS